MDVIIIAAIAANNVMGNSVTNALPWHLPEEFKHFKNTTTGNPIVMGRKTFLSLGKPLKNRTNCVITRDANFESGFEDVLVFNTLETGLKHFVESQTPRVYITGGAKLYAYALQKDLITHMVLTHLKFDAEGDVLFPEYNTTEWEKEKEEDFEQYTIVWYKKKSSPVE